MRIIKSLLRDKLFYLRLKNAYYKLLIYIVDDKTFIYRKFRKAHGYKYRENKVNTYNEKIIQRILNDDNPIYSELSDKYLVRNFVRQRIGEKYLIPLYGVYRNAKDIQFNNLPNSFVLKCNHDSGSVVVVKDKNKIDREYIIKKLNLHLGTDFYSLTREKHYKTIEPMIICEEFLCVDGTSPTDYKFHVFRNGTHKEVFIQCDLNRFSDHRRIIMTTAWEDAGFNIKLRAPEIIPKKPDTLTKMLELVDALSRDFNMSRVDLYEINGKVFFGEITFTHGSGLSRFYPNNMDKKLGEMWGNDLNEEVSSRK